MFTINITTLDGLTLIISFLSLTEGDDDFDVLSASEKLGGNDGETLFFASLQREDLLTTREELTRSGVDRASVWIAALVELEAKAGIIEPQFIIFDRHKGTFELDVPFTSCADFCAGQYETGYDFIAKFIIKPSSSVDDRRARSLS